MPATLGELSGWIGPRTDSTGRMVFAPLLCNTKLDVAQELKSNRRFSKLWVFLISHFEDMPELLPPRPSLQHLFGLPTRFTRTETDCICVKSSCQSYQEGTILFCSGHPIKGLQIVRKGIVALLFAGSRVGLLYEGTMLDCRWLMFAPHSFPSLWTYQAETACEIATVRPALLQTLLGVDTPLQSRFFWNQAYVLAQQLQILHLPPGSSAALSRGERRRRVVIAKKPPLNRSVGAKEVTAVKTTEEAEIVVMVYSDLKGSFKMVACREKDDISGLLKQCHDRFLSIPDQCSSYRIFQMYQKPGEGGFGALPEPIDLDYRVDSCIELSELEKPSFLYALYHPTQESETSDTFCIEGKVILLSAVDCKLGKSLGTLFLTPSFLFHRSNDERKV